MSAASLGVLVHALVVSPSTIDRAVAHQPHSIQLQEQVFSDAQLGAFVAARNLVRDIRLKFSQQIDDTRTDEDAQGLRRKMAAEMIIVIEDEGLTVEMYNEIIETARQDTMLRLRIEAVASQLDEQRS